MSEYKAHFVKPSPWSDALGWTLMGVLLLALMVIAYDLGYEDGARQAAPLAAPPTKTERAL